ncbi:hypothetical protein SAMN05216334_1175 [Nitrosomonas ureae]|uniref:Uncharacterized protein n=1 Tax=Nitrosomonas ureae TaxID=44577 RepID=A0A1H5W8L5_9PROT|nr:hypothetical protein SAMN05216334_1175 [Nitrosomonas ureae]
MTGRGGENKGAKREKMCQFVGFSETSKSAKTLKNPREHPRVGEKKPMKGWSLVLVEIRGDEHWYARLLTSAESSGFL